MEKAPRVAAFVNSSLCILFFPRPKITEGGALGAAIMAGAGTGIFSSLGEEIEAMVHIEKTFEPDPGKQREYGILFEKYKKLWPLLREYLRKFCPKAISFS
ncbi:MAG: hypothetical protein HWN71_05095 [Desulfobacterales bacterium]|nr:hypothetical protein [Desulfobacterales bacterium]